MLIKHFWNAWIGRREWKRLLKQYEMRQRQIYVLLMPEHDWELNEQALLHLDDFIDRRFAEGVVILAMDDRVVQAAPAYSDRIIAVRKYPEKLARYLLKYYCFYKFTDKFIIVSMTQPQGNRGSMIVGKSGVTVEDVVCLGIYNLRSVTKVREVLKDAR
ncbi:hypothetical protein [Brevibacillus fulvus]|uniref:O-glycosyl hydrolase n=1 Tax=Brevibacillus fulvus TaxID=1125967 RepID=A0A938XXN1_9BACL|nr:hypothetical protein [Brevibacillus fulvus]MBM7589595.1 O-glycosyl hydrolase [Brevibacillus fulvus]